MDGRLTIAAKGDRLGDMLHRQNLAFVLAEETLDRFGFDTLDDLVAWLKDFPQHRISRA